MATLRVLITDDELGMRLGAARALRDFTVRVDEIDDEARFEVELAETGEEAIRIISGNPPDILLLDHKLPGISGIEVLDEIARCDLDILTIMITAYASIDTAVMATKRGAYDFLAKPFTPDELKSTIRKAAVRITLAKQARKLADEKKQVRFEFIRVLGHELKAPLGAIEGYLDIVKKRLLGNDAAAYEQMIERSVIRVQQMRKLVLDLLDLTRLESGQKKREFAELDVRQLTELSIETVEPDARARNIAVCLHADRPVLMTGDSGEINIILNNLISNAVKYNRDDGRVDVSLGRDNGMVTIKVADTGIGMSKEECGKLFNDFVRIKNSRTRNVLGSGLGLSIVRKLARLYEGDALVDSEPDVGSTFTVTLSAEAKAE